MVLDGLEIAISVPFLDIITRESSLEKLPNPMDVVKVGEEVYSVLI